MNNNIQVDMNNLTEEEREMLLSLVGKANKPKSKVWKPRPGETYYLVDSSGKICYTTWIDSLVDKNRFAMNNCFKTEFDANFSLEKQKVRIELERFALEHNEGEIDWNDNKKAKYWIVLDRAVIDVAHCYWMRYDTVYFTSFKIAEQAIKAIGEDRLKKYYFEVEENIDKE